MKNLYIILLAVIAFTFGSCNKETAFTQTDVMNNMLVNKNWYLDYSIMGTSTKFYVGQSTYFVTYLKDGTTKDSDGLTGTYSVEVNGNQTKIHVQVKTSNGNPLEVIYNILSVGDTKLVLSKAMNTGSPTQLYFTSK
jgi:hypothetical protein